MNLMDFHEKLSSDTHSGVKPGTNFFSEKVTLFNVLNGTFPDSDILNIRSMQQGNEASFAVQVRTESIAEHAVENLDGMIVPGAYKPLCKLNVGREKDTLIFKMDDVS